jgi:hypothetical protein
LGPGDLILRPLPELPGVFSREGRDFEGHLLYPAQRSGYASTRQHGRCSWSTNQNLTIR